jgi:poly(3-hydroxybutyrate) depolymerase
MSFVDFGSPRCDLFMIKQAAANIVCHSDKEDTSMKALQSCRVRTLAMVFIVISAQVMYGGSRYKDIVFSSATATNGIQYGSNLNVDGSTASLLLDLYQPTGDTLKLRPLVICIHGGSLIAGSRGDMGAFCSDLAKRGYVSATIEYRLGIESPKGVKTIEEALLRGVQDTKAAVRFFRANAAKYGIDTSQIYLEGSSAGSMIAVHYAYWDQNELPTDLNQVKWGNLEGTSGNPGFSSAIKGIINYCGAILDPTWINADEVPVANFHGLQDTIVPPDSGVSNDFNIKMYGGVAISRVATQLGIYNQGSFFPLMGHGGNEDSLRVFGSNFIYSLMVLSTALPQDFTALELSTKTLKLFRYDSYKFMASALDKSGNKIILPRSMIQYTCSSRIGTIASSGIFTPSDHADSGYVYVKLSNRTDSCYVKTYDFKYFVIRPKVSVTDLVTPLRVNIDTYDADLIRHDLAITKFKLVVTNPAVGTIDSMGTFTGKKNGTTSIVASCNGYSDTSIVRVESAGGLVSLDPLESLTGWRAEGTNLDSLSVTLATDQKSAGTASFRIDYKLTYDPSTTSYMIYLSKDMLVYGVPDSIYLDVKSDGRRHRLYYSFADANGGTFRSLAKKYLNSSAAFDLVNTPMTGLTVVSGTYDMGYPLTLKRLEIQLAGDPVQGQVTTGTIYLDNLRLKYPGTVSGVETTPTIPTVFNLEQNYPNPFNPSTTIRYDIPARSHVVLTIYNILGQSVAELVNTEKNAGRYETRFDASALASGVYLYRLQAGSNVQTRKLMLLK